MNAMLSWKPDDKTRKRLLRGARIVLLLSLLPWIVTGALRSPQTSKFLMQLGVAAVAAIVAVKYYRSVVNADVRARLTEGRSMPVGAIAGFVLGYGEAWTGVFAFLGTLGLFGVIDHFIQ